MIRKISLTVIFTESLIDDANTHLVVNQGDGFPLLVDEDVLGRERIVYDLEVDLRLPLRVAAIGYNIAKYVEREFFLTTTQTEYTVVLIGEYE